METLLLLLVVGALVVVAVRKLHARSPEQRTRRQIQALKLACNGDQELVERLIFAELQKSPGIDYGEAAGRALANVRRDRR